MARVKIATARNS